MKNLAILAALFLFACQTTPETTSLELHNAIQQTDSLAFEKALKKFPKSISLRNEAGKTPLILATEAGQPGMIARLINVGAAVNDTMPNGKNALHRTDNPKIIKLLVEGGTDPHKIDQYGNTPLKFTLNYALRFASLREQKNAALSAFIHAGTQFPHSGEEGRWFLHNAAIVKHDALLRQLLANGADPGTLNNNGGTILHSAAAGGVLWLTDSLLQTGADVNSLNRYGQTALFMAVIEGQRAMTELLIGYEANMEFADLAGRTPLQYAHDFGRDEIIDLLLLNGVAKQPKKATFMSGTYLGQTPPGDKPVLFAEGTVSSVFFDHSAPNFSAEGDELYWSPVYTSRGDFIYSMKQVDGNWTSPQIEPFCRIGGTYMYPTLSYDGKRLFFASDEALPGQEAGKEMNIWFVERERNGWSSPQLVGFPEGAEYGISVAENGNLYFMALYEEGEGSADIYVSEFLDGAYSKPQNLGPAINSPSYEDEPYIDPQERFLLFASLRPGNGRIFLSRNNSGEWQEAFDFSERIPNKGDVRFPQISRDGRYLFFASNANGNWDIYWMAAPNTEL